MWHDQNKGYRCSFFMTILLIVLGTGLSACDSVNYGFSRGKPQLVAAPDKVSALLADAADRASNALETLAAIEQSRTPETSVQPFDNVPPELKRAVTLSWIGPPEPVIKMLADRAGYVFLETGNPPPVPIVVTVDVENRPVIDVLRDIGLQMSSRGKLVVDSPQKIIEVFYSLNSDPVSDHAMDS